MVDQAEGIRRLVGAEPAAPTLPRRRRAKVVVVTSGKGGVGKTSLAANLAIAAAGAGQGRPAQRVILVDADLGLANAHVLLGLRPTYNLSHLVSGERSLKEILCPGPGGILVVPGANGIGAMAQLDTQSQERLLHAFDALESLADLILIDTGAGIGRDVVSFATAADEVLLVVTPDPASMTDAYATLKTIWLAGRRQGFRVAVNMSRSLQEARAVATRLGQVAAQFLGGQRIDFLGAVPFDIGAAKAARERRPFVLSRPGAPASRSIRRIAMRLREGSRRVPCLEPDAEGTRKAQLVAKNAPHEGHSATPRPRVAEGFLDRLSRQMQGELRISC